MNDRVQVDRFRQDLAVANFRLQHDHFDAVKTAFSESRNLQIYSELLSENVSYGTSRLSDRVLSFEEFAVFVGGESFSVCMSQTNPPMMVCDHSETPYLDRIQIDPPLPDLKSSLDRVSGR